MNETVEKKTESYEDIFRELEPIISYLESEGCGKEYKRKELKDLSRLYSMIANDLVYSAKLNIALSEFQDRFKRRAKRKPLTARKMKSLNDDLLQLAKILKF